MNHCPKFWSEYGPNFFRQNDKIRTVVLYQAKNLGDLLLLTPVIQVLKSETAAEIVVCTKVEYADLIRDELGRVHLVERKRGFLGAILQAFKLRKRDPSIFIDLHGSFDSSLTSLVLRAPLSIRMAGLKNRLTDYFHVKVPMRSETKRHRIDQHLDVLRAIGLDVDLKFRKIQVERLLGNKSVFENICGRLLLPDRYVVIHPGSKWLFKTPSPSFWISFIDNLILLGLKPILTGNGNGLEGELLAYLQKETGVLSLGGKTSLSDLVHVINRSIGYVGVDTFASHVASACGIPGIVFFGPSDESSWGPLNKELIVVANNEFKCRPCNLDGCAGSKRSDCLNSLDPVYLANYANRVLCETV